MRSAVLKFNNYGFKLSPTSARCGPNIAVPTLQANTSLNDATSLIFILRPYSSSSRLAEVGKFETKQPDENCYPAGQPFLHRIFGYRGVTLFPWMARVHDIDVRKQYSEGTSGAGTPTSSNGASVSGSESNQLKHHLSGNFKAKGQQDETSTRGNSKGKNANLVNDSTASFHLHKHTINIHCATQFHPYYQVLIDNRDCPFVSNRTQTEVVTFLGHPDSSKSVYPIKGLDYVAHEDILPYTSHEEQPIHHELYSKLFKYQHPDSSSSTTVPPSPSRQTKKSSSTPFPSTMAPTQYVPTELLENWRNKHPWLELSRVYRETTENVRVTVIPFYLGHTTIEDTSFHWWRYCVRLENFSDISVQLRERHWKIFSQTTMLQTIKGRGVVGVEPLLSKSEPAYQYSSHVNLQDKSGHMWGTFRMQREDGHTFECRIPPFSLESSIDPTTPPTSKRSVET